MILGQEGNHSSVAFRFQQVQFSFIKSKTFDQADGAIGEPSDESDFSLLVWDSFSQEIRDLLFTFYGQKSLIYLKCSDFLLKKKKKWVILFIEKREKKKKS